MANILNWIAKTFSKDASKMLIFTGVTGWALSSLAQIAAITFNPKIKEEQKVFLIPQEFTDAIVNIVAFFCITKFTQRMTSKLFSTGKFAPKSVREYINKNPEIAKNVGKLDFDLEKVLERKSEAPLKEFLKMKNFGTTLATVCAAIVASNVVTPILRNKTAARVQKSYIKEYIEPVRPERQEVKTVPGPQIGNIHNGGSMRI